MVATPSTVTVRVVPSLERDTSVPVTATGLGVVVVAAGAPVAAGIALVDPALVDPAPVDPVPVEGSGPVSVAAVSVDEVSVDKVFVELVLVEP